MALNLINSFNIGDDATLELGGASYVTTAVVGGTTYVFVTGKGNGDNGVSVFSLNTDGTLTNVFNVADNNTTNLGGAFALTTAVVGGTTYLFVGGVNDSGVSVFSVGTDGHLTNTANVGDNSTLQLSLTVDVETMVVGGTTYLFSAGVNDNGVSVFSVGANGTLTNVDNVTDNATSKIQGPQGMATATVGGNAYLFVTGFHDDGIGVYSVAADGHLTNVFNVSDSGPMELDGPVDAITVAVGGTTYLVVSGFEDDGLTVFSVAADGHLTNVFNLPDDGTLKLDNPVGLSTTVLNGKTYLFVAGADDDGLSVFAVGNDGVLTNVKNVSDDATLLLDRVIGVTTVTLGGQTYVIAASNNDSGVSVFKFNDDTNHEPTLTAVGNDPTFTEGGAAADVFSAPLAATGDPGQSFTSLTLTVTNVTDGANEILSFLGQDLALTDGNSVAGVTVSVVGTTATVTFPGAADAAALQALIDGLAYRNASENPTEADRVITITKLVDSGGTAGNGDDTAALNIVSTVHVASANDAAIIDGDTAGDVTEAGSVNNGVPTATGNLDSADVDNPNDAWSAVAPGSSTIGGFGTYAVTADGHWTYTLDNSNALVQALNGAATLTDTFNAVTADGTTQLVTITIHAQNDAATITGTTIGNVTEAGGLNNGTPTATGNLDSADVDNPNDAWSAVTPGSSTIGGFGTYAVTADGHWTYTLDNSNALVQALNGAATLTDKFNAVTADGTTQLVTVTIHAQNDAATIVGDAAGAVTASGNQTDTGDLNATDPDNAADSWQAVAAGAATTQGYGTFALTADGVWTYTLDISNAAVQALNAASAPLVDTFTVLTQDGTSQVVTVTINGVNDAATITGTTTGNVTEAGVANNGVPTATGNLDSADIDNPNDAWSVVAPGSSTIGGFGTYAVTADGHWTFALDNNNAAVQALNGAATLADTFNVVTADGTTQLVTVTIHAQNDAATITGTAAGTVVEASGVATGTPTATGDLQSTDVDNTSDAWQAVAAGAATTHGYGTFALTADGVWTYTLDNTNAAVHALTAADTLTDTFTALTQDGTAQVVTVTIHGQNDAPVIDLPVNADSDVLWRHVNGFVSEWHMNAGQIVDNLGVDQASLAFHFQDVGDFNADGHTDILWRHDSGQVVLWTTDGNQIVANQSVATIGNDWRNEGVADFGGDGKSDVLWRNDSGQVALWTMDGAQITGNQSVATVGNDWHVQGLLDAGGDGKSDVLLRNDSGQVVLWTMDGAQITGNQSVANLGLDWNIVGTGDFGGDGKDDVLLRNDSGQVVIWQMDGARIVSNQSVATPGNDWHVQDVGDYNNDGRSDVLWRNDSGQVALWEMNGSQIVSNHEVLAQGQPAKIGLEWTALSHHYDVF